MTVHGAFADRVRSARKAKRWSQQELAEKADVTLGVIGNLERGKTKPTPANQRAILRALGLDVEDSPDDDEGYGEPQWPIEISTLHDFIGVYLLSVPDEEKDDRIRKITRFVWGLARDQAPTTR